MGFIDSYEHLEKLCDEAMSEDRRVSAYINETLKTPRGSRLVTGWDEVLRKLKHYRWVRNQIAHEPGCFEGNICEPDDALWLDNFYSRIMNQADPLALYMSVTRPRLTQKPKPAPSIYTYPQQILKPEKTITSLSDSWPFSLGRCFLLL